MSARDGARPVFAWAFGMCLSVLFVALWGRAVVADSETLGESLAPMARSQVMLDLVTGWLGDQLVSAGADPVMVAPAMDYFLESSDVGEALDSLVADVVVAAASVDPGGSTVDVRGVVAPAIPEVAGELTALGYRTNESAIRSLVDGLDPLVIRGPAQPALVGPGSPAVSRLGTAFLLALVGLVVFGTASVSISDDRVATLRGLLNRIALGGLSFAIFLRIGAWVVDPGGGRAPLRETMANLAASKWTVPLRVGVVAGLLALAIYYGRKSVRRVAASRRRDEEPRPPAERPLSISGRY